ncbi:putative LRR receptor-like serine/threonine-protein kinase [Prunus yedoensis var. nudiflora]|uniref:Putative LRR receptor-like serine/threonine-protein kinase n=1 Tax=Prunus yedoensis var. nudiflora TaxID=2094558 RepID=A0A314XVM4_PRUYE|nr:putative LRR receptor-like serine/threonine-protein kinase [Prunus yedoensis var. nudiflora]
MTLTNIDHEKQIYCFKVFYAFLVVLLLRMNNPCIGCSEREMQALLAFKQGLVDDGNILLSWGREVQNKDCCQWDGVYCSNHTGHVVKLDLGGQSLQGTISPKLVELQDLEYLNLSFNNFRRSQIPDFIGSFSNLRYLNLSNAKFGGEIPYQLENLTHLEYLDLSSNGYFFISRENSIHAKNLNWLPNLSGLKHLDLTGTDLSDVVGWLEAVNMLPKLTNLILWGCNLPPPIISSVSVMNSSKSLVHVDLSSNNLNSSIFQLLSGCNLPPPIISSVSVMNSSKSLVRVDLYYNNLDSSIFQWLSGTHTNLVDLDLSWNNLTGAVGWLEAVNMLPKLTNLILQECNLPPPIISSVSVMNSSRSLVHVDLSSNNLDSSIPDDFGNMSSLASLDLSGSRLKGGIPNSFAKLCRLRELYLGNNSLSGQLSDIIDILSKCAHNTLEHLDISDNHGIMGSVPENIGQMSKLETIDFGGNSLEGVISEIHFSKLFQLNYLDLSSNSLVLNFRFDWVPPFQLDTIRLRSCKMGPSFPKWLQTQKNVSSLDISDNGITDTIPSWLWDLSHGLYFMDLSQNQIRGTIGNLRSELPPYKLNELESLDLSRNQINGRIPTSLSRIASLGFEHEDKGDFATSPKHFSTTTTKWHLFVDFEIETRLAIGLAVVVG